MDMENPLLQTIRIEDGRKVIDITEDMDTYDLLSEIFHNVTVHVDKDTSVSVSKNENSRYFGDGTVCYRCGFTGHMSKDCNASYTRNCAFCSLYHPLEPCEYSFCYNCNHFGHHEKSCREKKLPRFLCKQCKGQLHYSVDCPKPWRSYKLRNLKVLKNFRINCAYCHSTAHFIDDCNMKSCQISIFTKKYKELIKKPTTPNSSEKQENTR
ncbi:hypothetical protein PAEPH01_0852 [Pancytospora epiphaga]|nr:hypothetical protein PAEPH01_0852 [Pancytospora epiphaga]